MLKVFLVYFELTYQIFFPILPYNHFESIA